ncbi:MAG TPA: NADH-quinone oxidoreductase subunit H [Candidatus Polarisedimenticolia bacterium]|nr:NADH-quinone oxidoreductase subunit H [Candidatus Polarisedimenticolia bacterium]
MAPALIGIVLALSLAPVAPGVIARTKSLVAGRKGPPLLQGWYDIGKLLRKGAVISGTTTWLFRAGPVVGLAALLTALAVVPSMGAPALLAFPGDLVLLVLLLALTRFVTVLAALDTGSSFEGMGASREAAFSVPVEPALLLGLATLARGTGALSLSEMLGPAAGRAWLAMGPALALVGVSVFVLLLAENSRVPVDDPNTHLELTMIHEVMVLDHGGPDLALLEYAAALKLWLFEALLVGLLLPFHTGSLAADAAMFLTGMALVSVTVGLVESSMARLQLPRVPQLLLGATVLSGFSLILTLR